MEENKFKILPVERSSLLQETQDYSNIIFFLLLGNVTQQDCEYDHIEVRSKLSENELRKHGLFCGTHLPPVLTSEGNVLRIEFASDNSVQKTGFAAVYFTGRTAYYYYYD